MPPEVKLFQASALWLTGKGQEIASLSVGFIYEKPEPLARKLLVLLVLGTRAQAWRSLPMELGRSSTMSQGKACSTAGEELGVSSPQTHLWAPALGRKDKLSLCCYLFALPLW